MQALLTNPLVHTDHRCTETICQFLNPECNFKQYTPSYSVGKAKLGGFVKKAKHDFGSFMDLFLITEEESRKAAMAAMAEEHAKWAIAMGQKHSGAPHCSRQTLPPKSSTRLWDSMSPFA